MFGDRDNQPDPRSPVQPARDPAPSLLLAAVVAIAAWGFQQSRVEDSTLPSGHADQRAHMPQPLRELNGTLAGLFSSDDYPPDALDRNEQGTVEVRLDVDKRGRVAKCTVLSSSGFASLDGATCGILQQRARFQPARDRTGKPVVSSTTSRITWKIAD